VNSASSSVATTSPRVLSRPWFGPEPYSIGKFSFTLLMLLTYVMAASTSIGAIATACSHENQPAQKPASGPCEKYGNRPVPPATGYAAPSSA